jgi:hypothetical protein
MGKKLIVLTLFISSLSCAQNNALIRCGLLRAQATYSPGFLFESNTSHYYLHGNIEGYVSDKLSIAGEGYYFLANGGTNAGDVIYNHSAFFGSSYHFIKNMNDFYIGIQPGISITKFTNSTFSVISPARGVNPVFSSTIGYNLYFYKYFHFFVQARLIIGKHNYYPVHSLNEFRLSAGLGFNINTIKQKL